MTAICVVVAPEGIEALKNSGHPVRLLTASIDDGLNENAFLILDSETRAIANSGRGSWQTYGEPLIPRGYFRQLLTMFVA